MNFRPDYQLYYFNVDPVGYGVYERTLRNYFQLRIFDLKGKVFFPNGPSDSSQGAILALRLRGSLTGDDFVFLEKYGLKTDGPSEGKRV